MAEITIYSTKSTYVNDADDSNFGSEAYLIAGEGAGSSDQYMLVEFDLTTCPAASIISTALFYLNVYSIQGVGATVTIARNTASWVEATVTWSTKPASTGDFGTMALTSAAAISVDITDLVKGWKAGTYDNYGIYTAHAIAATNTATCRSDDYATEAERPRLVITTIDSSFLLNFM